jgi:hypothetical protein
MALRLGTLALLTSAAFGQWITPVNDTSEDLLISYGMADCIDALVYINDESVDTTTIGTGSTRTIEGYVPVPTTETDEASPIMYAATITRLGSAATTTLVITDLCTFKVGCETMAGSNYSCTFDIDLVSPSFNVNDTFVGTATDNADLATTWDGTSSLIHKLI